MDGRSVASECLQRLRRTKGLSQRALAQLAGVPQPTIAEIESGRREPSISLLSRITEAAGQALQINVVRLDPFSALATARRVANLLSGGHTTVEFDPGEFDPENSALRKVLDLRDALRQSTPEVCRGLVAMPPALTGASRWDAFIAAVVEDECARKNLDPPRWTNEPARFTKPFWYLSGKPELQGWVWANAPGAYVRHGVPDAGE